LKVTKIGFIFVNAPAETDAIAYGRPTSFGTGTALSVTKIPFSP
jgi:hypothetical protein